MKVFHGIPMVTGRINSIFTDERPNVLLKTGRRFNQSDYPHSYVSHSINYTQLEMRILAAYGGISNRRFNKLRTHIAKVLLHGR